ncbi:MAG: hypothetical protein O8C64_12055 [Candidatus Methanoperedens sp.]|nr:hypothetical protein [Candidatus Methanoperedens sp.]MCZ7404878.1 hypothetical protein [Candidatus Methanoperedens sp.]
MGYEKRSFSLEEKTARTVDKIANDFGIPKSCVVNIAVSKPQQFKKLAEVSGADLGEEDDFDIVPDFLKSPTQRKISEKSADDDDDIL